MNVLKYALLAPSLALLWLAGCDYQKPSEKKLEGGRFTVTQHHNDSLLFPDVFLISDTKTGTEYLFVDHGHCGGIIKLEAPK
jgi:hypothetical protein